MSTLKVNAIRGTGASSDAISVNSTDGTCTAKITNNLSNRNLIINGAMNVAQRGTSSTTNGYGTVDRMKCTFRADADEACTQEQVDVASGTTPYTLGFRKAVKQTNGNQTSGAQQYSYAQIIYAVEAQDIATSGWNYTSASSYITVSFWAKASVAQNYNFHLETTDGTAQLYSHSYALSANTWTKITKTIPGNSNITIDNNNGAGLYFILDQYLGTHYTTSGHTSNTWAAAGSFTDMAPDMTTTWWTTNDATFELTGLQIEVGDVATDFEHRSYQDEFLRCARYYQEQNGASDVFMQAGKAQGTTSADVSHSLVVPLRASPTVTLTNHRVFRYDDFTNGTSTPTVLEWNSTLSPHSPRIALNLGGHNGLTNNEAVVWCPLSTHLYLDSEF